ncbi:hypothetical protein ACFOWX_00410 [Sphingorhabdus arenilitoris]|uniref:Uncharacterized protein n=1 Tax=Sphingorhabdus arenilitoris TaxID=1490041 RepID=A0ABV8RBY0_9SPHN
MDNPQNEKPPAATGGRANAVRALGQLAIMQGIATFRCPDGRKWRFRGQRARILSMLANSSGGVSQRYCLPWCIRLGATIHVMREAGLDIETSREGATREARYRLLTAGRLIRVNSDKGPEKPQ